MDLLTITEAPYATDDAVRMLLAAFHDGTLPKASWNHRAHMTVALSFGRSHAPPDALRGMRAAILRFNDGVGIVSTPDSGYHETITVFYMHAVGVHVTRCPAPPSLAVDANAFMDAWGRPGLPLDYYTRERLFSRDARREWLPPDVKPLPQADAP
jgi:hypothetical protein